MSTKAVIGIVVVIAVLLSVPLLLSGGERKPEIPYIGQPEIIELTPANDKVDVAHDLNTLTIRFNVPMQSGFSLTGQTPEIKGAPQWSKDKMVLTVPVSLLEGHNYQFGLNSQSFRNFIYEHGVELTPIAWKFSTLKANGDPAPADGPPQVLSLDPPNGGSGVSPLTSTFTITFDVPMQGGFSLTGQTPEIAGKPQWSSDKKTLVVPVKLVGGHK
jgi:hypothetical protein